MNGLGTLAAALPGQPVSDHALHRPRGAQGQRRALRLLRAQWLGHVVLCTTGLLPLVLRVIPLEVAAPVIVWFGLVTVGQAVTEVPNKRSPSRWA